MIVKGQDSLQKSAFSGPLGLVSTGAVPKWHLATWDWHRIQDSQARKGTVLAGILKPPEFQPKRGGRGTAKLCTSPSARENGRYSWVTRYLAHTASSCPINSCSLVPEAHIKETLVLYQRGNLLLNFSVSDNSIFLGYPTALLLSLLMCSKSS